MADSEKNGGEPEHEDRDNQDPSKFKLARFDASFSPLARPGEKRIVPWYRDRQYLYEGWLSPSIWRSAVVEAIATACVVFLTGQITATLINYETKQPGAYVGISGTALVILFIYATAAPSGGHINPMVTLSTVLAGLCPLSRGVLYICGQTAGAAVAGGLLRGVWGPEVSDRVHGGGCFFDPSVITPGRVFLAETCASFVVLYLIYGVGLDPRQGQLIGPHIGPVLVGLSIGLVAFTTSSMVAGYAGAQMNPARCFAFGVANLDMKNQWIWWCAPSLAATLSAALYQVVPPHHNLKHGRSYSSKLSSKV